MIYNRISNDILYTTIFAKYSTLPKKIIKWYFNGLPINSKDSIFEVKTDGLNAMLKFKQSQAGIYGTFSLQIYGTFSLQIEGTAISDKITLPPPKKEGLSSVYPLW